MTDPALDLAELDDGWPIADAPAEPARDAAPPEPVSGVRARPAPAKPPRPLKAMSLQELVELFLRARFEAESRMDSGQRVAVDLGGERFEVVMAADRFNPAGEIVARGGLRVERRRDGR